MGNIHIQLQGKWKCMFCGMKVFRKGLCVHNWNRQTLEQTQIECSQNLHIGGILKQKGIERGVPID